MAGSQMILSVVLAAVLGLGGWNGAELPTPPEPEGAENQAVEEQGSMEAVLEERKRLLEGVERSGLSYFYELYPGELGTLCVSGQTGTTHGTSTSMLYVSKDGTCTELVDLLPNYGFGACYYVSPRDIAFADGGRTLTFITPVKEVLDWEKGQCRDWGDTRCTFDTVERKMVGMEPLN